MQWHNQVGAERHPRAAVLGNFFDETYNGDFYLAKHFQQILSTLISMLENYDVYFISISLKLMISQF